MKAICVDDENMVLEETFADEFAFLHELVVIVHDLPWAGREETLILRHNAILTAVKNMICDAFAIATLVFRDIELDLFARQGIPNEGFLAVFEDAKALTARN